MHIGILRTDSVRPEWVPTFGEYPDMFERLLLAEDTALTFTTWNVEAGELPDSVEAADGFLITGSKSSVYDDKDWIRALERFVRECHAARRKVMGICFGHQLVAQALGGSVGKSDKGWGVGVNCYKVDQAAFDLADGDQFCLLASHQDQVMTMPPGAQQIATSDHCEVAGMTLGEHILTFQGHPEFMPEYSREIMSLRHDLIGAERVAEGLASLEARQHEGDRVARWMLDFIRR
ncbi:MAG: GMP synthase, partial [Luminiphilus sp.]|nr:GMP synthase [Luminiphilus sp.]